MRFVHETARFFSFEKREREEREKRREEEKKERERHFLINEEE